MMAPSTYQESRELFVRRWGEMGATWGISRTMAEIHALLFTAPEPLCTDDVIEQLNISRGNASMNLRQLLNWGLIRRVHTREDRKIYYEAESDVWEMFRIISRERQRREVEPILETIERCRAMVDSSIRSGSAEQRKQAELFSTRLGEMHEFLDMMNTLSNLAIKAGKGAARRVASTIAKMVQPHG
jgi:DNA-binding transcriptional regulator GbsR (MarR family)